MFNRIIFNTGSKKSGIQVYYLIKSNLKFNNKDIGSSISCNGVCLTLTKIKRSNFFFIYLVKFKRSNFKKLELAKK